MEPNRPISTPPPQLPNSVFQSQISKKRANFFIPNLLNHLPPFPSLTNQKLKPVIDAHPLLSP